MKDFEKLTDEEIYNLTEEQILVYKKLLWAENGIQFPVKPNEPEAVEVEQPDLTIYRIRELGDSICFLSIEEAKKMVDLISSLKTYGHTDYESKVGYKTLFVKPGFANHYGQDPLGIVSEQVYSRELFNSMATNLQTIRRMKEQYEKDCSEYNKVLSTATELTVDMDDKILSVRELFRKRFFLLSKFRDDYLPLAENNEEVAIRFLCKAYTVSEDDKNYILANYKNEEGKE